MKRKNAKRFPFWNEENAFSSLPTIPLKFS